MSMGMYILIGGALFAVLGALMLFNHGKIATTIIGVLLLVAGLSGIKVGYDMDQSTEVEYTVTEITAVSARDNDNHYRITLKNSAGIETWIYVSEDNLWRFPQDTTISITKAEVKRLSTQDT